ncbi:hypothetical protein GQ457_06G004430 [Hibiscus cannabinus]
MERVLCERDKPDIIYGNFETYFSFLKYTDSLKFTTVIHHGGFFLKKSCLIYTDEFVNYFDVCDVDRISMFEIRDMVEVLGITYTMKIYWEVSINPFEVKLLANDVDVLEMVSNLPRNHYVHVYLEDVTSLANYASVEPEIDVEPKIDVDEDGVNDSDHVEHVDRIILEARDKGIITLVESIKSKLMQRIAKKKDEVEKLTGILCPKIQRKSDNAITQSHWCWPLRAGGSIPVKGENQWTPHQTDLHVLRPIIRRPPGRPNKTRRREPDEAPPQGGKMTKKGVKMSCKKCGGYDHNVRTCRALLVVIPDPNKKHPILLNS